MNPARFASETDSGLSFVGVLNSEMTLRTGFLQTGQCVSSGALTGLCTVKRPPQIGQLPSQSSYSYSGMAKILFGFVRDNVPNCTPPFSIHLTDNQLAGQRQVRRPQAGQPRPKHGSGTAGPIYLWLCNLFLCLLTLLDERRKQIERDRHKRGCVVLGRYLAHRLQEP